MQTHQPGDATMHAFQSVFFEPWIGSQYETTGLWGRKVLIVGESHYDEFHSDKSDKAAGLPEPKQILERTETKNCISEIINNEGGAPFWTKARYRIGGDEHESASADVFWQKVAFYNFVQTPVSGRPGTPPTKKQFEESIPAFYEVLEILKPDRIVVISDKTSGYVPQPTKTVGDIKDGDGSRSVDYFLLEDGTRTYIVMLSHPSSSFFSRALSTEIHRFITTDWAA